MRIFSLFDRVTSPWRNACKKGCSTCCTTHVTMTSLEGETVLMNLDKSGLDLPEGFLSNINGEFVPTITTNGLANCCIQHLEPPEESKSEAPGPCPFLTDNVCPIYEVRPMACRVMFSKNKCRVGGSAEMDKFWITVNQVFLQAVEALDCPGNFGAMAHVIESLRTGSGNNLLDNIPVPGLMIPNEHRASMAPILDDLNRILSGADS